MKYPQTDISRLRVRSEAEDNLSITRKNKNGK